MTSSSHAAPSLKDGGSLWADGAPVEACGFCRRRLADEFFFRCRKCHASCCYIHMSRHLPSACARQVRNGWDAAVADGPEREEETRQRGDVPLIQTRGGSSANV